MITVRYSIAGYEFRRKLFSNTPFADAFYWSGSEIYPLGGQLANGSVRSVLCNASHCVRVVRRQRAASGGFIF